MARATRLVTPAAQTVNGHPYRPGNSVAQWAITGNATATTHREVTVPFTTCSACTYRPGVDGSGTTYHEYTPLGCGNYTRTVYGTIYYPGQYKSQAVTLTLDSRPYCGAINLL